MERFRMALFTATDLKRPLIQVTLRDKAYCTCSQQGIASSPIQAHRGHTAIDRMEGQSRRSNRLHDQRDRSADRALAARRTENKGTGLIRFEGGDVTALPTLPKRVEWDQDTLAAIVARIREAGYDPADYVRTTYEVSERAYGAWPSAVRRRFEPTRTLKPGKPRYVIEVCRETEAA